MKKTVLLSFILLLCNYSFAQRFPSLSITNDNDVNKPRSITWSDSVRGAHYYRGELLRTADPIQHFRIIKDWIEDNRYVQVWATKGGSEMYTEDLFTRTNTSFTFNETNRNFSTAIRIALPDEDYSIGMADNISKPQISYKFTVTANQITYTITTDQQASCGFVNSDEWVAEGDGAARGGVPTQPIDPHKEYLGCNGGTHKDVCKINDAFGEKTLICPYTYTCSHYIRQVPRSAGRRKGYTARATGGYIKKNIAPGQVYIGPAGEYGGDPFAPWQFTYTTTVKINLDEMAKVNNMSKQKIAYNIIYSMKDNILFLPTNPIKKDVVNCTKHVSFPGILQANILDYVDSNNIGTYVFGIPLGTRPPVYLTGDNKLEYGNVISYLFAYSLWELLDMETYLKGYAEKFDSKVIEFESAKDYKTAIEYCKKAILMWSNDERMAKFEEVSYKLLKEKIADNTASDEDLKFFLYTFKNRKPFFRAKAFFKTYDEETDLIDEQERIHKNTESKYYIDIYTILKERLNQNGALNDSFLEELQESQDNNVMDRILKQRQQREVTP